MENRNLPGMKILLRLDTADTERDALLCLLLARAEKEGRLFCRLRAEDVFPDELILQMAVEDYNRIGSEGISYKSYSNIIETYRSEYSENVMALLRRLRRMAVI